MRSFTSVVPVALVLLAAPAARGQDDALELSILVEPGGSYSDYEGFDFDLGYGLALGWRFGELWTAELRGIRRGSDGRFASLDQDTYQLGLRRAFDLGAAWRPYVQAGAHHQSGEIVREVVCVDAAGVTYPCPAHREDRDELGAFVGGGVDWAFSRPAALRFDGRFVLYESDATGDTEEALDLTAGLVFRF